MRLPSLSRFFDKAFGCLFRIRKLRRPFSIEIWSCILRPRPNSGNRPRNASVRSSREPANLLHTLALIQVLEHLLLPERQSVPGPLYCKDKGERGTAPELRQGLPTSGNSLSPSVVCTNASFDHRRVGERRVLGDITSSWGAGNAVMTRVISR